MTTTVVDKRRKPFVDGFKKQKEFLAKILHEVEKGDRHDYYDKEKTIELLRVILANYNAPARLWDNADDYTKDILFDSFVRSIHDQQNELIEMVTLLQEEEEELRSIQKDPFEGDDQQDSVGINVQSVTGDDDDEDDQQDTNLIPDYLYHGTLRDNLDSIKRNGLLTMSRKHVFFDETSAEAFDTALRHGGDSSDVVVIKVRAKEMVDEGYNVHKEDFGYGLHWCVPSNVAVEFLDFN